MKIDLFIALRQDPYPAITDRIHGGPGQFGRIHIPLIGQEGLNRDLRAIAMGHHMAFVIDPVEPALRFGQGDDLFAGIGAITAMERHRLWHRRTARGEIGIAIQEHCRFGIHHIDHAKTGALAHIPVIEIMGRGDFHRAGALFGIGIGIGHNRDRPPDQRQAHGFADQMLIAFIIRVHGHAGIAQHGFRACCGDDQVIPFLAEGDGTVFVFFHIFKRRPVFELIAQAPEMAILFDLLHLKIRDRRLEMRIPIDEPFSFVNQSLVIKINEYFQNRIMEIRAVFMAGPRIARRARHGKGRALPITGTAQSLKLIDDLTAGFFFPGPDLFQEFLAPQFPASGIAFCGEFFLDNQLGRDPGMIRARLPERVKATHPVPADHDILKRVVERMPGMERSGDIGRRDHDGKALGPLSGIRTGPKGVYILPGGGNLCLCGCCVESLVHRHRF